MRNSKNVVPGQPLEEREETALDVIACLFSLL